MPRLSRSNRGADRFGDVETPRIPVATRVLRATGCTLFVHKPCCPSLPRSETRFQLRVTSLAAPPVRREERLMSPRVQLVIHPTSDSGFSSHAEIALTIDVPDDHSVEEVVATVREHLRTKYPEADISIRPSEHVDFDTTWNVYRDGLPAAADAS
jgi:hypothetical protein